MLGRNPLGSLQLQRSQDLLNARQVRLGRRQVIGVADEPGHVGPVVVAEGGELARHLQHGVHRVRRGNGLINLIYLAALLLAVGVVTLGIGLLQA